MIDFTKPVQTRDGRKVRVLCTDGPRPYSICGYIGSNVSPSTWRVDGSLVSCRGPDKADLINVPETRVGWVNMYPKYPHTTRAAADDSADPTRIACVRVTYEVGQFDEEIG